MSTATASSVMPMARDFVCVPTCILKTLEQTRVDLFLKRGKSEPFVLYLDAGSSFSVERIQEVVDTFDKVLYVRTLDYEKFSQDVVKSLGETLKEESLETTDRYQILQFSASFEIEHSMRMVNCERYVDNAKTIGKLISNLLSEEDVYASDLFKIVRHDYQTFVHVTNVAGYATLLANGLGISDPHELELIATGGLLHDIGKRHIPQSILSKTEPLQSSDWAIIRQHPQKGYEDLLHRQEIDHGQLMMTYQHHEHIDGNGYPVGVASDEIHPWAKLLAVVDVFDALTGERPYRSPATALQAVEFIESRSGTQFDKEIVRCWASLMKKR